jgi:hypothetical protein
MQHTVYVVRDIQISRLPSTANAAHHFTAALTSCLGRPKEPSPSPGSGPEVERRSEFETCLFEVHFCQSTATWHARQRGAPSPNGGGGSRAARRANAKRLVANAIRNAIVPVTGWTRDHLVDTKPDKGAAQRPERHSLDSPDRTLNPQVLGSNPRGRTPKALLSSGAPGRGHSLDQLGGHSVVTGHRCAPSTSAATALAAAACRPGITWA